MKKLYKFLKLIDGKLVSNHDGKTEWKIGDWLKCDGEPMCCEKGFHASRRIVDAHSFTQTEILAEVEVRGVSHEQKDKEAWSEMRVVKAWHWTKEDSVAKAIFAARLVLKIFEKKYPNDDRPRKAIEAAEKWLKNPTEENRAAADAAAYAAARAADAAAYAAARTADVAACAAAYAAADAACAAAYAASYAAYAALDEIEKWHLVRLKTMKEYVA
jgi:hypothetical protein